MATCRTCAYLRKCIEKATKEGREHNVDFDPKDGCTGIGYKSDTNADRIRAMSDEELAKFIANPCECSVNPTEDGYRECGNELCKKHLLEWLKQPAEGE